MSFLAVVPEKRKPLLREFVLEKDKSLDINDFEVSSPHKRKKMRLACKQNKHTVRSRGACIAKGIVQFSIPNGENVSTYRQYNESKHESPELLRKLDVKSMDGTVIGKVCVKPPEFSSHKHHVNTARIGVRMYDSTQMELVSILRHEFSEVRIGEISRYGIVTDAGNSVPLITLSHKSWNDLRTHAWKQAKNESLNGRSQMQDEIRDDESNDQEGAARESSLERQSVTVDGEVCVDHPEVAALGSSLVRQSATVDGEDHTDCPEVAALGSSLVRQGATVDGEAHRDRPEVADFESSLLRQDAIRDGEGRSTMFSQIFSSITSLWDTRK